MGPIVNLQQFQFTHTVFHKFQTPTCIIKIKCLIFSQSTLIAKAKMMKENKMTSEFIYLNGPLPVYQNSLFDLPIIVGLDVLVGQHTPPKQIQIKKGYQSKRLFKISILMPQGSEKQEMKILPRRKQELPANPCRPTCQPRADRPALVSW